MNCTRYTTVQSQLSALSPPKSPSQLAAGGKLLSFSLCRAQTHRARVAAAIEDVAQAENDFMVGVVPH